MVENFLCMWREIFEFSYEINVKLTLLKLISFVLKSNLFLNFLPVWHWVILITVKK
jgi:hypothetical protein